MPLALCCSGAGVITLVVGTALYGVVRAAQLFRAGDETWVDRFLLGRDRREASRWLLAAAGLSVLLFAGFALQSPERIAMYEHSATQNGGIGADSLLQLTVAMSVLALIHAFRNDGLLVGWGIVLETMLAILLFTMAFPLDPRPAIQLPGLAIIFAFALGAAAVAGTLGSLVGSGPRRIIRRRPEHQL